MKTSTIWILSMSVALIYTLVMAGQIRLVLWRIFKLKGGVSCFYTRNYFPVEVRYYDPLTDRFRITDNMDSESMWADPNELFPAPINHPAFNWAKR